METSALPIRIERKASLLKAIIQSLILGFIAFNMIALIRFLFHDLNMDLSHPDIISQPLLWIPVFMLLVACFMIYGAASLFYNVTRIEIQPDFVEYSRKRFLFSTRSWTEPLRNYDGILKHIRYSGRKHDNTVFYCISLKHQEDKKCIEIGSFLHELDQRNYMEELSRLLKLDILGFSGGAVAVERRTDELDKKISERRREGMSFAASAAALPYMGKAFKITGNAEELIIARDSGWGKVVGGLFLLASLSLVAVRFTVEDDIPIPLIIVLGVFASIFLGSGRQELVVSGSEIIHWFYFFGRGIEKGRVRINEIESIEVDHDYAAGNVKRFNLALRISSDNGLISFGHAIKREELEWLAGKLTQHAVRKQKQ